MRSSVCVFSASRKAGNPVAVVLDPEVEYSVAVMGKIAERCVEPFVVVVQPGKKSSRYSLRISVLTPGRRVPPTSCRQGVTRIAHSLRWSWICSSLFASPSFPIELQPVPECEPKKLNPKHFVSGVPKWCTICRVDTRPKPLTMNHEP